MSFWEKFALGFLGAAETTLPLFIHTSSGVIIMNASEQIVNGALSAALTPAAVAPAPTPISVAASAAA